MLRYSYFFLLFRASLTLLSIPLLSSIYNVIAVNIFSACFWKPHQTMLWCLTFKRNLENSRGVYRIFPHCGLPGSFSLLDSSRFLLLFAFSLENFLLREVWLSLEGYQARSSCSKVMNGFSWSHRLENFCHCLCYSLLSSVLHSSLYCLDWFCAPLVLLLTL